MAEIHRRMGTAVLAVWILGAVGCFRWELQRETIDLYIRAVQDRDHPAAYRLSAPGLRDSIARAGEAPDSAFEGYGRTMAALHERFERDRESGQLAFTPDGIALIRALGLGRGAFYRPEFEATRTRGGHGVVIVEVILPYDLLDRPDLARPGTVFWRLGPPFGRIYPILHGMPYVGQREELHRLRIRADLEACPGGSEGSPTGWCLLALQALPETAEFQTVASSPGLL